MERAWDVGVAHRGAHDLTTLWGGVAGTWHRGAGEEGHGMIAAASTICLIATSSSVTPPILSSGIRNHHPSLI